MFDMPYGPKPMRLARGPWNSKEALENHGKSEGLCFWGDRGNIRSPMVSRSVMFEYLLWDPGASDEAALVLSAMSKSLLEGPRAGHEAKRS